MLNTMICYIHEGMLSLWRLRTWTVSRVIPPKNSIAIFSKYYWERGEHLISILLTVFRISSKKTSVLMQKRGALASMDCQASVEQAVEEHS